MSKIEKITITIIVMSVFLFAGMLIIHAQEKSWDGKKADEEGLLWEKEIDKWERLVDQWEKNKNSKHRSNYGDEFNDDREYCDENGCWSQDSWTEYVFTGKNGKEKWVVDQGRPDAEATYKNGYTWYCSNDCQAMEFNGSEEEYWESSNFGQDVIYTNSGGDRWESSNFGQVVLYSSSDGEKWESRNFGQSIEYEDKEGNSWEGSEDDSIDDMD